MATFIREHDPAEFVDILAALQTKRLPVNRDRRVAGTGRSQAFGLIRRWSYRPWISRNTWLYMDLWKAILDFAVKNDITGWDAVQVNDNYVSAPHKDKGNCGASYIVGFGDYTAGALDISGETYDIRHRGHRFNGSELTHFTCPYEGQRYCLVFFSIVFPPRFQQRYTVTTRVVDDKLEVTDGYDDSVVTVDRRGGYSVVVQGRPMPYFGFLTSLKARAVSLS